MGITKKEITVNHIKAKTDGITLLPINYREEEDYKYQSTSLSFFKYAKDKTEITFYTDPEILYEQRSVEWFGPVILITSSLISQNPEIVSITCGVISNYLTDFFKGQKNPEVSLKVVYRETEKEKITEIEYQGSGEDLSKLQEAILEVAKK
ncbi:hypothetical protein [Ferrimonas lipolytica]|uniref:Uncharacterized protein n=1 Tax=Ferrimonas lipolytica TaxID=2724191 RepID=A0A6H1UF91_9GAMM|nr:hypothetical protein [Ferrimonas lipolytica]QIZ76462.1 hypothetical protein HER31_06050 [Ferrimonas lipolytica]